MSSLKSAQPNNRPDNQQNKKHPKVLSTPRQHSTEVDNPIIPDNQADRLEEAKKLMEWERYDDPTLLEYLRYYKGGSIGEVHIEAAITTKIAEERQADYKDSLAELEIAMHHELDLMESQLLKELPTAAHQVLTDYIYRRHREIEAELEALKGDK